MPGRVVSAKFYYFKVALHRVAAKEVAAQIWCTFEDASEILVVVVFLTRLKLKIPQEFSSVLQNLFFPVNDMHANDIPKTLCPILWRSFTAFPGFSFWLECGDPAPLQFIPISCALDTSSHHKTRCMQPLYPSCHVRELVHLDPSSTSNYRGGLGAILTSGSSGATAKRKSVPPAPANFNAATFGPTLQLKPVNSSIARPNSSACSRGIIGRSFGGLHWVEIKKRPRASSSWTSDAEGMM
ncbi:hypothetical protein B0H14DRAFT_3696219 [Mycena olivaceomarginata]|nr:hypothetical protein B0H14DRAFT_3696219 [Mycena olivaceomarginata]